MQLKFLDCPGNVAKVVHCYLSNRKISIFCGGDLPDHKAEKVCPQLLCIESLPLLLALLKSVHS